MWGKDSRGSIRDSLNERGADGRSRGTRASRAYDRHFEGYEERIVQESGRTRTVRVYVGKYHAQRLSLCQQIALRATYWLLWLAAAALFALGATRPLACNAAPYVAAGQAICIACLGAVLLPLISYATLYNRMTMGEYRRTALRLRRWTPIGAGAFAILLLLSLIGLWAEDGGIRLDGCMMLLFYGIGAVCMLFIYWLEGIVPYDEA